QRMDDVRAVMDAVGSERAALLGTSEGGPMSVVFAATYPQRTIAPVLYGTQMKGLWSADYPWAATREELERVMAVVERDPSAAWDLGAMAPSVAHDAHFQRWFRRWRRAGGSPGAQLALMRMDMEIDVRAV